ncbi:exonuclease SbcCD subunit D [Pseudarthrobacter phenanthrenivorans]|uniref:Nuclease SbcCD subunit D n=2 Tax=Pseudarthrobacter phenanthrenivorans TaxID=361575 RepID=A0A3B0FZ42_PSEPS|nr:exonuclease SbcCD subunit D [Pseudarthrobacter phenanthrenivorans]ADX73566.1 Exodeoxyribonuclease I subunit D [Pseudarthrobacter phenanthrenivorans Sphe3]RKO26842.1 exonuclease SbcCD subunit D [Pseudarthrobacter phenanthrenivorans]TPV49073.1 exonuclease SbcCD subunit D [Pseudarthrobacter phenanthrenivorans]
MRLLHTSDWHLGRSFHGVGMLEAQRNFVSQLVDAVTRYGVDVVLVAGDVYDRALPGVDVVRLLDEALVRITSAGAKVVLTSGNHDSAIRLGFASRLLERGGVHLRTRVQDLAEPLLLPLADGRASGAVLAIYGIPWLEPRLVADQLGVDTASHFEVTRAATGMIRADLERRSASSTVHSVVLAHTFASGGISSDSERDLSIGGVGAVPLDLFDGFGYTALGHLHGRQVLSPQVRYSGSPLAYSFSEAAHQKGGWLVDVGVEGVTSVQEVLWEAPRKLAVLRGPLAELLESADHQWAESAYCQVTLTDNQRPARAMERLRSRFPDTLVLGFEPAGGTAAAAASYSSRLAAAPDDLSVCCGFLDHVRGRIPDEAEKAALAAALDNVRLQEASR